MTSRTALSLLVTLALAATASAAPRCETTQPPEALGIDLTLQDRCDPLVPEQCLMPFPNDYFTVRRESPTGRRVSFVQDVLPANVGGVHMDPVELNRLDGFSPGSALLLWMPATDLVRSGAPPITGIISAIIAGFVLPFLGGSYVTVSGPAAGLAPILLASMMVLGKGDLGAGYPLLLVAICIAGVLQLVLAKFKFARLCAIFPAAVVEGMLCAIGLLIIVKQLPALMGVKFHAHEFYEYILETPTHIAKGKPMVFLISMLSLALMFKLSVSKAK